jgi:hypothetical protein
MEYSEAVFVRMIYCVRCAVNRWALQSIKGFLFLSNGRAGKGAIPIFFDNFNVSRKIIFLNSLNNHAALMNIASFLYSFICSFFFPKDSAMPSSEKHSRAKLFIEVRKKGE